MPLFDANDPRLSAPGDMPARIGAVLQESGAPVPVAREAFVRSIVESIAQAFARAVHTAGRLTDRQIDVIHIVEGGSLNRLLCQATADRSGLPVLAGPVEATAIGNVLVQARAHGWFGPEASLETLRPGVRLGRLAAGSGKSPSSWRDRPQPAGCRAPRPVHSNCATVRGPTIGPVTPGWCSSSRGRAPRVSTVLATNASWESSWRRCSSRRFSSPSVRPRARASGPAAQQAARPAVTTA